MKTKQTILAIDPAHKATFLVSVNKAREARLSGGAETMAKVAEAGAKRVTAEELEVTEDGIARINVSGVLLAEDDWWLDIFDVEYTSYPSLIGQLSEAENDKNVDRIEVMFDSPGGDVDGMFAAADAIHGLTKPKVAYVNSMAASAAYTLASQFDSITALRRDSAVGSVGVVSSYRVNDEIVDVTSTDAPLKRPNPGTEEGQASIRVLLDEYHDLMVETIARGRGVTTERISEDYGKGAVMLTERAMAAGMVDRSLDNTNTTRMESEGTIQMNLQELKAKHKDIYEAAVEEGVQAERTRVRNHVNTGRSCGDYEIMIEGILGDKEASEMNSQYIQASVQREVQKQLASTNATTTEASAEEVSEAPSTNNVTDGSQAKTSSGAKSAWDACDRLLGYVNQEGAE